MHFLTHQVRVSYIEIYLEKIKDLLNPAQDNLNVREGGTGPAGMSLLCVCLAPRVSNAGLCH